VTGGASDIVKVKSFGEIPGQLEASFLIFITLGLIKQSNTHHSQVNKTKQHTLFTSEDKICSSKIDEEGGHHAVKFAFGAIVVPDSISSAAKFKRIQG